MSTYGFGRMGIGGMMMGGGGAATAGAGGTRTRRPRKLTYVLPHPDYDDKHVGGVNAVTLAPGCEGAAEEQLYTAGRDGTVRAWNLAGSGSGGDAPSCALTMEGHAGWVNDLAVLKSSVTGGTGGGSSSGKGAAGVNVLLSASSDRTVKVWNLDHESREGGGGGGGGGRRCAVHGAGDGHCVATLERHSDYVMALAAPSQPGATKFASAGLGTDQIFLWDINAVTAPATTLRDGGKSSKRGGAGGAGQSPFIDLEGQKESVYALAMDQAGTMLVSGCTQNLVRLWDTRGANKPVKLKGHAGNVRCAAIDPTGRLCLTGSSDHTIKLWDLGQQRCVQTLAGVHGCSVWCAVPDASWHFVYSGGSDGRVYVTDLAHKRSTLLFKESHGVLNLCRDDDARRGGEGVWAATMGTDVRRWSTEAEEDHHYHLHGHHPGSRGRPSVSSAAASLGGLSVGGGSMGGSGGGGGGGGLRDRLEADLAASSSPGGGSPAAGGGGGRHPRLHSRGASSGPWFNSAAPIAAGASRYGSVPSGGVANGGDVGSQHGRGEYPAGPSPAHAVPIAVIAGAAPIVEHAQLNDRRRVLAKDAAGEVTLWDVTACTRVRAYLGGKTVDFSETLKSENAVPVSIPSWFSVDARSGSLAVTLSPSSSFGAEAYAMDMGMAGANDEIKLNLGVQTIHALLRDWVVARDGNGGGGGGGGTEDYSSHDGGFDVNALGPCDDASVFRLEPEKRPLLICEAEGGAAAILMRGAGLEGTDAEEAALPGWIVEVARGTYKIPDSPKMSFFLTPCPGEKTLSQGKVTAPRVLGIRKVCTYVITKLDLEQGPGVQPEDLVEILCNDTSLDPTLSLATVSTFVWKRGDDVQLHYRLKKGATAKAAGGGVTSA